MAGTAHSSNVQAWPVYRRWPAPSLRSTFQCLGGSCIGTVVTRCHFCILWSCTLVPPKPANLQGPVTEPCQPLARSSTFSSTMEEGSGGEGGGGEGKGRVSNLINRFEENRYTYGNKQLFKASYKKKQIKATWSGCSNIRTFAIPP